MKVELCPQCGSGKVSRVSPLSDTCKCDACAWAGKESLLMSAQVPYDSLDTAVAVAQQYLLELTNQGSLPIGRAMFSAGLIQRDTDSKVVGRLIRAAITAAHRATLEEIDKFQKESTDGSNKS